MRTRTLLLPVFLSLAFIISSCKKEDQLKEEDNVKTENECNSGDTTRIFMVVESMPEFPGGEEAMYQFLDNNIQYPDEAKENNIQGRVFVTFVVEKDGAICSVEVLRGIGHGCDEEAVRVVEAMPNWIPGKQRGEPVRVQFNLPIKFTLNI